MPCVSARRGPTDPWKAGGHRARDNGGVGRKAYLGDFENTTHLLIGLNREDVESLQRGEVFSMPTGQNLPLTEKSDIVFIFEETDEELIERMKAHLPRSKSGAVHRHARKKRA